MLTINLEWDSNALAAPQSFRDSVQAAANVLDAAIYNTITVNVGVGYGEYDNNSIALSSNESLGGSSGDDIALDYTELRTSLASNETSATDVESVNALPNAASLSGQTGFTISAALARAFGIIAPAASAVDGYVGFPTSFSGDVLINAAITEEAHALGLLYGDLGLFAYTSPGNHFFGNTSTPAYYSLDGGTTNLGTYDVGFDPTLFNNHTGDPLDVPDQGVTALTGLDLTELDAIGFDVTSTPTPTSPSVTTTSAAGTVPVVNAQNVAVVENKSIPVASLITSVSVPAGDSVYKYVFYESGSGSGELVLNGVVQPSNTFIYVLDTQLRSLNYVAGSSAGSNYIQIAPLDTSGSQTNFAISSITTTPGKALQSADFNNDNKSDILLQNTNGAIVVYTQANLGLTGASAVANPGPTWHVMGSADFNGDGQTDVLLQNNNGAVVDYLMVGTSVASVNTFGSPGASWHVRGTADFNADGQSDILLQNDNGNMVVWNTNGYVVTGAASIGFAPPGWTVEGVADFNGDGHPDVLVQNTNGSLVDYLMNGTTITAVNALGNPGAGWAVTGTGDYSGDGKADILLHNDNGTNVAWDTDGTSITNSVVVDTTSTAWTGTVAGVDLNGDGATDLVVQNKDSTIVGFTTNGAGTVTAAAQLAAPGIGWHTIGNDPVQFIDGTQVAAGLTATPGADQFDFTSSQPGSHAITGFDPQQDTVAFSSSLFPSFAAMQAHEAPYAGGTLIALSSTANVVIQGIAPSQLDSSNFVFR